MTEKDGFRKRRKRPKGWHDKAIKEGLIAGPDDVEEIMIDGDPRIVLKQSVKREGWSGLAYRALAAGGNFVVDVPVAKVTAERK